MTLLDGISMPDVLAHKATTFRSIMLTVQDISRLGATCRN